MRRNLLMLLVLVVACLAPAVASAGLSDRYAVSATGALVDPEIDALASTLAGRPVTVICEPTCSR